MNALLSAVAANQNHPAAAPAAAKKPHSINDLRDRVSRLERLGSGPSGTRAAPRPITPLVTLGVPALDRHLPGGGLPRGALHELAGAEGDREQGAAAAGFAALWLARLQAAGPLLWIARAASLDAIDLHPHGLTALRLDPNQLILVAAKRDDEALWAMEEGLKAKALGAVVGEIESLDLTASRRLQLAAEAGGVTAFVLRRWRLPDRAARAAAQPIAAVTRWRIASVPAQGPAGVDLRWRIDLTRCRGGKPGGWILEKADGSDELHASAEFEPSDSLQRATPLHGDLAPALGGRSLAAGARN
jgi:protein ImuA